MIDFVVALTGRNIFQMQCTMRSSTEHSNGQQVLKISKSIKQEVLKYMPPIIINTAVQNGSLGDCTIQNEG